MENASPYKEISHYPMLLQEYRYWKKKHKSKKSQVICPFPDHFAQVITRGWAFLNIPKEQHAISVSKYKNDAEAFLKELQQ